LKILKAATANAENNDLQSREDLKIVRITADKATWVRRFRPKARGRVGAFDRPTSHITIEVDEVRV
jgi:large subunit ribosomal protein L22